MSEAYFIAIEDGEQVRHGLEGVVGYTLEPMLNAIRIYDSHSTYIVSAGNLVLLKMPNAAKHLRGKQK